MHTELTSEQIEAAVERVRLGELTDEIRSAGRAVYIHTNGATTAEYDDAHPFEVWSDVLAATAALAAARPHIEAEVREQIAAEIEAMPDLDDPRDGYETNPHYFCFSHVASAHDSARATAARIARGGASDGQ